ncbi:hypothetical protein [Caulobacter sp. 17J80-11]|uniref:hypothetical protein n=1 Tax=Caulobacter sp. 17J80-11 TaxID=2763502 RepID=UPI0016536C9F|nr:hypothetical protein [Caulobacter sp. 17J80-11]MBC6980135.1 hypothetical protein [Caulobacter sp. 17J80-11]
MAQKVLQKHGDLEIDEDPGFQDVAWTAERVGWAIMLLLLLAAVAGVFGNGPFSRAQTRTPEGGLSVDYPRFARMESADELELRVRGDRRATVEIDGDFSRDFLIESIQPEPVAQRPHRGGVSLDFEPGPGQAEQRVTLHLRPRRPGFPIRAEVGLRGEPRVEISTFVFP